MDSSHARRKLGLIAGSVEMISLHLASFVPSNAFRRMALRAWGAKVGRGCAVHHGLQVRSARKITIGEDCFIAENVVLDGRGGLIIGASTSINSGAQIWSAQHDWRSPTFAFVSRPVQIGSHAWISARTTILPGSRVGDGVVLGAGAVASGELEPWGLYTGQPAKRKASRPKVDTYRLEASKNKAWWW